MRAWFSRLYVTTHAYVRVWQHTLICMCGTERVKMPIYEADLYQDFFMNTNHQLLSDKGVSPYSGHGLSQHLETGCPNRGFIDCCVSKVWYKVHTTNRINPIYIYRFCFFRPVTALCVL